MDKIIEILGVIIFIVLILSVLLSSKDTKLGGERKISIKMEKDKEEQKKIDDLKGNVKDKFKS
jgi:cell division protein FtsL